MPSSSSSWLRRIRRSPDRRRLSTSGLVWHRADRTRGLDHLVDRFCRPEWNGGDAIHLSALAVEDPGHLEAHLVEVTTLDGAPQLLGERPVPVADHLAPIETGPGPREPVQGWAQRILDGGDRLGDGLAVDRDDGRRRPGQLLGDERVAVQQSVMDLGGSLPGDQAAALLSG